MLPLIQTRDRLIEGVTEIGVLGAAAIPRPPTRVYRELHEIGKPPYLLRSCRFAARQGTKLVKIDCIRAL